MFREVRSQSVGEEQEKIENQLVESHQSDGLV